MASMFIRHRVRDFGNWKPVFDEHESARRAQGVTAHSLHHSIDDPNDVIIAFRVADLARAREFATSEDLRSTMQRAGVEGAPEMWFTQDLEDKQYP
jgi:hypothetical protein